MSSFEKLCCAFDENFVRCAHYRVCNANSPAAVELFTRDGTLPELLLRKMDSFQNSSFCWNRKELENFEFLQNSKLRLNKIENLLNTSYNFLYYRELQHRIFRITSKNRSFQRLLKPF